MNIKLPHLPFRFDSPEGLMEVTVRRGNSSDGNGNGVPFVAGLSFIQPGPRALERINLSARSDTYAGALRVLKEGFKVNPGAHEEHSVEYRVLNALCFTKGVVDLDM